jgi:hypothetical protein
MTRTYSNLPPTKNNQSSSDSTVKFFDQYYQVPLQIDNNTLIAIQSFFEKRGFEKTAAEYTASIIMSQAKTDNFNASAIIDTLRSLSDGEVSGLVAEILNHNRFKTSALGIFRGINSSDEIQRNILA